MTESAKNIYGLGEGLVTDFSGTSSRITNALIQKASNPYEVAQAFESAKQDAKVQAFVLRLQGQEQAALRVEMQWETEFALSFVAINKAGKLGQVAKSLGERETAWKASSLDNAGGGAPGKNPNSTSGITVAEPGKPYTHPVGGAEATRAAGEPLVSKGSEVTPEVIKKALQGDPAISAQGAASLPAVQRYVDRLIKGDAAPAIKMDGNVIVDGNHRYIAAKILGRSPDVTSGTLPHNKVGRTKPVSELKVDEVDWGNK